MTTTLPMRLQSFLFRDDISGSLDKYCFNLLGPNAARVTRNGSLALAVGDTVSTDTYNNAFSVARWLKDCPLESLTLELTFDGSLDVEILCTGAGVADEDRVLWQGEMTSDGSCKTIAVPIERIDRDLNSFLSLRLGATTNTTIIGGGWSTIDPPGRETKLHLCITTFKRQDEVKHAAERLSPLLSPGDALHIVDNEQVLSASDFPKTVRLHANPNLGGAGGFSRGMLEAKRSGATHVLLMDDDALCSDETILRTRAFLTYADDNRLAIAGIMLINDQPETIYEAGGISHMGRRPQLSNVPRTNQDYRKITDKRRIDYGAWWYFAFNLEAINYLAFPFFVRGDDVQFSVMNKLLCRCINGVHTAHDEFAVKKSPTVAYLQVRDRIVNHILGPQEDAPLEPLLGFLDGYFYSANSARAYDTAHFILEAIADVIQGPEFFNRNAELGSRLKELSQSIQIEKAVPVIGEEIQETATTATRIEGELLEVARKKRFGHLPFAALKDETATVSLRTFPDPSFIGLKRKVRVIDATSQTEMNLKTMRARYWMNRLRYSRLRKRLKHNFAALSEQYKSQAPALSSPEAWERRCKL
ncbi:glycosyltransferase family 2 protein [Thioclava sp. BHET1]|nr:glycosyltransferase family 2 protein [Thioclava sp. BHET1]